MEANQSQDQSGPHASQQPLLQSGQNNTGNPQYSSEVLTLSRNQYGEQDCDDLEGSLRGSGESAQQTVQQTQHKISQQPEELIRYINIYLMFVF